MADVVFVLPARAKGALARLHGGRVVVAQLLEVARSQLGHHLRRRVVRVEAIAHCSCSRLRSAVRLEVLEVVDGGKAGGQLGGVGSGVVGVVARLVHLEVEVSLMLEIDVSS